MSSLWRENKAARLCHSCSRDIEPSRKRKRRTRCFQCAREDARRSRERRDRLQREREPAVGVAPQAAQAQAAEVQVVADAGAGDDVAGHDDSVAGHDDSSVDEIGTGVPTSPHAPGGEP
jgi:hypothetical protein